MDTKIFWWRSDKLFGHSGAVYGKVLEDDSVFITDDKGCFGREVGLIFDKGIIGYWNSAEDARKWLEDVLGREVDII